MFFEYEKEKPKLLDEATIKDPLGNLYVSKGLWRDIINSYERKEILDRLKDLIDRGVLSFRIRGLIGKKSTASSVHSETLNPLSLKVVGSVTA